MSIYNVNSVQSKRFFLYMLPLSGFMYVPVAAATGISNIYTFHSYSLAMGNAVTADPPGVGAVHFNPAGLAKLKGRRFEVQGFVGKFDQRFTFSAPEGYNIGGYSDDPLVCEDNYQSGKPTENGTCQQYFDNEVADVPALNYLGLDVTGPAPASFWMSYQPESAPGVTFANAFYSHFLSGSELDDLDPRKYLKRNYRIIRLTWAAPSVGFRINDEWSMGASIGFNSMALDIGMDLRFPNEELALARRFIEETCDGSGGIQGAGLEEFVCGEDLAINPFGSIGTVDAETKDPLFFSVNFGVLYEPYEWLSLGAVYQAESQIHVEGKATGALSPELQQLLGKVEDVAVFNSVFSSLGIDTFRGATTTNASGDLVWPAHFQAGSRIVILPELQWNFDINWDDFEKWDEWVVKIENPDGALAAATLNNGGNFPVSLGYESVWTWGTGIKYSLNDRLALRIGYEDRSSVIPKDRRSVNIPIFDAKLIAFGATFRLDRETIADLSFAWLSTKADIPANSNCHLNCTGKSFEPYNPYAGLDIKTDVNYYVLGMSLSRQW